MLDPTGIDIADPAVLKALLATAETERPAGVCDGARTTLYQGTFAVLYKIYIPWNSTRSCARSHFGRSGLRNSPYAA